ncbi:unnamed protein product [Leptosia nina]|uniref:D-isomer specific 2-hydroxyacid dehydrogenase catalytic domain-containing protein n=1 Tax=Leptosia nina TaxID=320188 RepID=A0AAV1K537_9NEOP
MRFLVFYRKFCESKKFRVFITRPDMPDIGIKILREKCDLTIWKSPIPIPRKDFLTSIRGMNALFVTIKEKIDGEVLDAAGPQLKVVATISVGHDHLDVAECRKRGIRVANTPELLTDATAELTVSYLHDDE